MAICDVRQCKQDKKRSNIKKIQCIFSIPWEKLKAIKHFANQSFLKNVQFKENPHKLQNFDSTDS